MLLWAFLANIRTSAAWIAYDSCGGDRESVERPEREGPVRALPEDVVAPVAVIVADVGDGPGGAEEGEGADARDGRSIHRPLRQNPARGALEG